VTFGDAAARLCGAAAQLLGWRPDEFWSATPADLANAVGGRSEADAALSADDIANLKRRMADEENR
jgi:Phage tail assembly chaperone protein, TAC